jgi:deoxyribodipyrimidine photo-lyase
MKTSIVWFTTSLRINDNKPLLEAIAHSDQVIPLYIFDTNNLEETNFGTRKMGKFRLKFLMESLHELDQSLRAIGSKLLFKSGDPKELIPLIVQKYDVEDIYTVEPPAQEERILLETLERSCWSKKCVIHTFETSTLFVPSDLPFPLKKLPDVFTKFRTIIEKECHVKEPLLAPTKIVSPLLTDFEVPKQIQDIYADIVEDERTAFPFKGGLQKAKERLVAYFYESEKIAFYKETRNGLIGSDYSSKFSPWLALGCISPREIIYELMNFEKLKIKNDSTYWLYFELLWREYFHWVMRKYDTKLFFKNGIKDAEPISRKIHPSYIDKWKNGQTGNDFVDANMNELNATGFISNRGRQNVASYLCNDLKLDWRFGAAYFEEQLIDYDVCSNWGNWAYIAGVGNDPRGHRVFNVDKQANDYDKEFTYRKLWSLQLLK